MPAVDVLFGEQIPYPGNQPEVQPEVQPVVQNHPFESALTIGNRDRIIQIWRNRETWLANSQIPQSNIHNETWIIRTLLKDEKCTLCKSKFTPARHQPCSKCGLCSKCHTTTITKEVELANTIATYQRELKQEQQKYERQRIRFWNQERQTQTQLRQLLRTQETTPIKGIPENYKTTETVDEAKACKVCLTNEANCLIIPCCHKVACSDCIKKLPNKKCPVCRTPFTQVAPIYEA
jgi:hypothetical protein